MIIDLFLTFFIIYFQDIEDISSKSYVSGSLTQHKMETLGTHEAVRQARQRHLSNKQKEQSELRKFFMRYEKH